MGLKTDFHRVVWEFMTGGQQYALPFSSNAAVENEQYNSLLKYFSKTAKVYYDVS